MNRLDCIESLRGSVGKLGLRKQSKYKLLDIFTPYREDFVK